MHLGSLEVSLPGLDKSKGSGWQVIAQDKLALRHIKAFLCHSCGDDNVQLSTLHLLQHFKLHLHHQQTVCVCLCVCLWPSPSLRLCLCGDIGCVTSAP